MKHTTTISLAALSVAVLLALAPYAAQAAVQAQTFEGTLQSVDSLASTITVSNAEGESMEFHYSPETQVSGGVDSVQGLAGQVGTPLAITYELQEGTAMATRIEVSQSR